MPPKKKFVLSTTVRWSAFEVMLFRYLSETTDRSMADNMRTAIRFYAKHLPSFDAKQFLEFAKNDMLKQLPKGPERERVLTECSAFLGNTETGTSGYFDRIASAKGEINFKPAAQDIEFE